MELKGFIKNNNLRKKRGLLHVKKRPRSVEKDKLKIFSVKNCKAKLRVPIKHNGSSPPLKTKKN